MSLDRTIAQFFADHHTPALTHLFWAVTTIGDVLTLLCATLLLIAWTCWRGRYRDAGLVLVGMAGASFLTLSLKHLVQRQRPGGIYRVSGAPADNSYSFPSGHTLHTTVFVILLVAVLLPLLHTPRSRWVAALAAATTAIAVGTSRLYLGYHWATDVLAGLLIGGIWALTLVSWWRTRWPEAPDEARPAAQRDLTQGSNR